MDFVQSVQWISTVFLCHKTAGSEQSSAESPHLGTHVCHRQQAEALMSSHEYLRSTVCEGWFDQQNIEYLLIQLLSI